MLCGSEGRGLTVAAVGCSGRHWLPTHCRCVREPAAPMMGENPSQPVHSTSEKAKYKNTTKKSEYDTTEVKVFLYGLCVCLDEEEAKWCLGFKVPSTQCFVRSLVVLVCTPSILEFAPALFLLPAFWLSFVTCILDFWILYLDISFVILTRLLFFTQPPCNLHLGPFKHHK